MDSNLVFEQGQNIGADIMRDTPIGHLATLLAGMRNQIAIELRKMEPSWPVKDAMTQIGCLQEALSMELAPEINTESVNDKGTVGINDPEVINGPNMASITITTGSDCV